MPPSFLRPAVLAAALLAAPPARLPAQGETASALRVDGGLLRAGVDSLDVYVVRGGDTIRTGRLRDELRVVRDGAGRELWERVYVSADRALGDQVDTIADVRATLAPVRLRSRATGAEEALDFAAGGVAGWVRLADGDSVAVRAALAAPAYNSASFDLVLRAAPLAAGWRAEVPVFLTSTRAVAALRARVAGVEAVDGRPCWRVAAEFAGTPVTFWVDRETRALRRQVLLLRSGDQILFAAPRPAAARGATPAT